jgi:hypothetical protein
VAVARLATTRPGRAAGAVNADATAAHADKITARHMIVRFDREGSISGLWQTRQIRIFLIAFFLFSFFYQEEAFFVAVPFNVIEGETAKWKRM